jgi:hypothetical protein
MIRLARPQDDQRLTRRDRSPSRAAQLDDLGGPIGEERDFHLHRLQHQQLVTRAHGLTRRDEGLPEDSRHGRVNGFATFGHIQWIGARGRSLDGFRMSGGFLPA